MEGSDAKQHLYTYKALEHTDSIRLLELLPARPREALRIRLLHVRKTDNPSYEALSYAWGNADLVDDALEVDSDTLIQITRNLRSALCDLRHETLTRTLWVDAICIDQSNVRERGHQVAQMGGIYQAARAVVVWLGHWFQSKLAEINVVRDIAFLSRGDVRNALTGGESTVVLEAGLRSRLKKEALYHFLARPWFERVWTVQEFALAKRVCFQIGPNELPYDHFKRAITMLGKVFDPKARHNVFC